MAVVILISILYSTLLAFSDSAVTIDITPSVIDIGQTESLHVTCRVEKGNSPNILFSISLFHSPSEHSANFTFLASINNFDNQVKMSSPDAATMTFGTVSNSGDSHIRLTWKRPAWKRTGVYKCDASGIESLGKPVTISQTALVSASRDFGDAVSKIYEQVKDLYEKIDSLHVSQTQEITAIRKETSELESSFKQLNFYVSDLQSKNGILRQDLKELNKSSREQLTTLTENVKILTEKVDELESFRNGQSLENTRVQNEIKTLRSEIVDNLKIETGTYECGQSFQNFTVKMEGTWKAGDIPVRFKTLFNNPPKIIQRSNSLDVDKSENLRFRFEAHNVTAVGFTGRCVTWGQTIIYSARIEWTAISLP